MLPPPMATVTITTTAMIAPLATPINTIRVTDTLTITSTHTMTTTTTTTTTPIRGDLVGRWVTCLVLKNGFCYVDGEAGVQVKSKYALRLMKELRDQFGKATDFTKLDLKNSYNLL
ncbi:hypothetical protein HOY82DRAFT_595869 [Tuber indicum]|nr:hypothetical protein HOY82DRAFT_595869 [Tuber indicum]